MKENIGGKHARRVSEKSIKDRSWILRNSREQGGCHMKCPRCEGLMVRDHFYDPDGPFLRMETLRCLNCGETVYPKAAKKSDDIPGRVKRNPAPQAA